MNRARLLFALTGLCALLSSSCVVTAREVAGPAPCPGAVWVAGHYGPYGHWHRGHWQCGGAVVVVP